MRSLILLFTVFSIVSGMYFVGNGGGRKEKQKFVRGDWPERFPKQPAGFDFKCQGRQFGTVTTVPPQAPVTTVPPQAPITTIPPQLLPSTTIPPQAPVRTIPPQLPYTTIPPQLLPSTTIPPQALRDIQRDDVLTTTVKVANPTASWTTFWIRSPTPPNAPETVVKGGAAYTVGSPQFATVKVVDPFAPDNALAPDAIPSGDLDFGFKNVGTPKAPRKVIDPDA
uniref:Major sperm protein n=1 Tax=Caenorhabditis tropicalis TaxID=1561998 RepID=A0A1I7UHC1_9PELO